MSRVNLVHGAMRTAINDTRTARSRLADDRGKAQRSVESLLGGGWSGIAADAYAGAWDEWLEAADRVEAGLGAMADLLEAHQRDMTRQDEESQRQLDTVSARIIDRLG
jgi:WXG100 family type VII secretion target